MNKRKKRGTIMIEAILAYIVLPLAIVTSSVLFWYVRRLLNLIEDNAVELRERFRAFHLFLDETYKMDLFFGEPRLKQLLDMIKEFDGWVEEYENRIIKEDTDVRDDNEFTAQEED